MGNGFRKRVREALDRRRPRASFSSPTSCPRGVSSATRCRRRLKPRTGGTGVDYFEYYLITQRRGRADRAAEKIGAWEFLKGSGTRLRSNRFSSHEVAANLDKILARIRFGVCAVQINYGDGQPDRQSKKCY
jgi:predicted aldo/keto reductase-like oxidoreductase